MARATSPSPANTRSVPARRSAGTSRKYPARTSTRMSGLSSRARRMTSSEARMLDALRIIVSAVGGIGGFQRVEMGGVAVDGRDRPVAQLLDGVQVHFNDGGIDVVVAQ